MPIAAIVLAAVIIFVISNPSFGGLSCSRIVTLEAFGSYELIKGD